MIDLGALGDSLYADLNDAGEVVSGSMLYSDGAFYLLNALKGTHPAVGADDNKHWCIC